MNRFIYFFKYHFYGLVEFFSSFGRGFGGWVDFVVVVVVALVWGFFCLFFVFWPLSSSYITDLLLWWKHAATGLYKTLYQRH